MVSANIIILLAIFFVLQFKAATSDFFLPPLLSPIVETVCKEVECGKGTCKPSKDSTFLFACECDPGWKQSRSDHEDHLDFLPCIIPNCTLDFSCSSAAAPSPIQEKDRHANHSIFDPCFWSYCGGGSCNRTSTFTHTCECREGYDNLLNVTGFPCFKECAIGMDCASLGIGASNKSSSSTPSLPANGSNQENVCKEVVCGKGTCKPSKSSNFLFACECDPGWKQSRSDHEDNLDFLPCIIPNCTLDFSCSSATAPSPFQEKDRHANQSFFDPCFWSYCGGGSCNRTSTFTHTCECQEGYENLLNVTGFPCFKECAIGMDCARLGIGASNLSSSSTPSLPNIGSNQAASTLPWNFYGWIVSMMCLSMMLHWK